METANAVLNELLERADRDNDRWINGDASNYAFPDDGTILGAVGGYSHGGAATSARQSAAAAHWLRGSGDIEFLNGGVSGDLAWLTFIARSRVVLTGTEAERRWDLRVTEVFRRNGDLWERIHRHADPLVDFRSVSAAADLLTAQ